MHGGDLLQPGLPAGVDRAQQRLPIAADGDRHGLTGCFGLGQVVVFDALARAVIPRWRRQRAQPLRGDHSQGVERRAQRLTDPLQPVQGAHGREHMG